MTTNSLEPVLYEVKRTIVGVVPRLKVYGFQDTVPLPQAYLAQTQQPDTNIVVLLRTSPLTLLGLALAPLALRAARQERRTLLALGGYALLFGLAVSIGAKKFDRYLLPIWPALEIIAAAGLTAGGAALLALLPRRGPERSYPRRAAGRRCRSPPRARSSPPPRARPTSPARARRRQRSH